jgi:hypothetical protein
MENGMMTALPDVHRYADGIMTARPVESVLQR